MLYFDDRSPCVCCMYMMMRIRSSIVILAHTLPQPLCPSPDILVFGRGNPFCQCQYPKSYVALRCVSQMYLHVHIYIHTRARTSKHVSICKAVDVGTIVRPDVNSLSYSDRYVGSTVQLLLLLLL